MKKILSLIVLAFALFSCQKEEVTKKSDTQRIDKTLTINKKVGIWGNCSCTNYISYYYKSEADQPYFYFPP